MTDMRFAALFVVGTLTLSGCGTAQDPVESPSVSASDGMIDPDTPVASTPTADNPPEPVHAPTTDVEDPCNAGAVGRFVGREGNEAIRTEVEAAAAPVSAIRWVGPGTMTTEDYSTSRLNVMVDAGNMIVSAHCG